MNSYNEVQSGPAIKETMFGKLRRKWNGFRYHQFLKKHPEHGLIRQTTEGEERWTVSNVNPRWYKPQEKPDGKMQKVRRTN